ncbi:MAG: cation-transporting P-type ATPase [Clostridia bacterium]|nr:cation-transporting P-type ATPase [Clostridia bacterium]
MRLTDWHLMDKETVEVNLRTDLYRGLSEKEANKRRKKDGDNRIWQVKRASATRYARDAAFDLTTVLLILCAVFAAVLEGSVVAISICAVLVLGIAFRVATYIRAKRIFELMADEGIPNATVIRDGKTRVIRGDALVRGDVISLGEGDVVPCDLRIISDGEVRVSEKGITENKSSVIKRDTVILSDVDGAEIPCEYRVNMLFAGSVILSGSCRAVVTSCSENSLICMKKGGIVVPSGESLPAIVKFEKWSGVVNLFMIALILIVSLVSIPVRGTDKIPEVFFGMLSLAAASVSTYFGAVGYIIVAVPVRESAKGGDKLGRAVIKDCSYLEDIAFSDRLIVADSSAFKSGDANMALFWRSGKSFLPGEGEPDELINLLFATLSMTDDSSSLSGQFDEKTDTGKVMLEKAASHLTESYGRRFLPTIRVMDRSVSREEGFLINTVVALRGESVEAVASGSVPAILSMCDRYVGSGGSEFLGDVLKESIIEEADAAVARGEKVIAVATRNSPYTYIKHAGILHSRMRFEGFVSFSESLSESAVSYASLLTDLKVPVSILASSPDYELSFLKAKGILTSDVPVYTCDDFLRLATLPSGCYAVKVPAYGDPELKRTAISDKRCAVVGKISKGGEKVTVITKEALDSRMMNGSTVGAAVSPSERRPIPQTLKRRSKITVYPSAAEGNGGFTEICKAFLSSVLALINLSDALLYIVFSQSARIIASLAAVFTGTGLTNPVGILALGLLFDFAAVLTLAFREGISLNSRRKNNGISVSKALFCSLAGAVTGMLCALVPLAGIFTNSGTSSASFISMLLVQFSAVTCLLTFWRKKKGRPARAYYFYAALVVATCILTLLAPPVAFLFGDTPPASLSAAVSMIPALFVPLILWGLGSVLEKRAPDPDDDKKET